MGSNKNHQLGFGSMVLLGINGIVGSGIFLLPGQVMDLVGNWSMIVYAAVALLVLSIAWCFAQCSALFNRNGGAYIYAKEAFGDFIGFEIGVMRWVVGILAWASVAVGFMTALGSIWNVALEEPVRSLLILSFIGCLGLLNILGVRIFQHINNVVTIAKLIPLFLFIFIGGFYIEGSHYTPLIWEELEINSFGSAALLIFYAFGGFETLVVAAGEMKNPKKNLPLVVMLVISFCSFLYFVIQCIAIGLLGDNLAASASPLADAAHRLFGNSGKWLVTLVMLISIGGINIAASFIAPRSGTALAEDGMIPRWIGVKGRFGTPTRAIALTMAGTAVVALSGSFAELIVVSVISRFVQYISTCLAVYVLYKKFNISQSLSKRCLVIAIPAIALVGIGWLLLQATFSQLILGLGALIFGLPFYWLQKKRNLTLLC